MTPIRILLAAVATILLLASESSRSNPMADWFRENMIDAQDGMIDMSDYLSGASGFFPVPIIITEPAVGVGIGAAVAYFHPPKDIDASVHPHSGPPSISVGFAAVTDNDTKLGGGAHLGSWRDDHVRYLGALAAADINLKFFPNLGEPEWVEAKRWGTAEPRRPRAATFHLGVPNIAICGDGWSQRPRVEAAWRSGRDAGAALAARLR